MADDTRAKRVLEDCQCMQSKRSTYEAAWRDIRYYVRPNTVDFNGSQSPGDERTQRIYDGTAMQANCDLAGELHADLFNPSQRSFGIEADGPAALNRDPEVMAWTDMVADAIFAEYADDLSLHTASGHEALLDIGAFGNCIVLQEWDADGQHLVFQTHPLACCWFDLNANGQVDKLCRMEQMTIRQIRQKFPDVTWEGMDREKPDKTYTIVHMVEPRDDAMYGREDGPNMPYRSCWVIKEKAIVAKEGGYVSFPYHVARWQKVSDETYGRGPAINCLPEIRMLQRQQWTVIRAAEKAVDPPLVMPSDGFLMPYRTAPGSINYMDPSYATAGVQAVQSIEHRGNFPVTFEIMNAERLYIKQCFYTDWSDWIPKTERQTAREIDVLQERKLNKMAPLLGRLQSELMVSMIQRSYELLNKAGFIPPAPAVLQGRTLKVSYVSASARAQAASEVSAMTLYGQQLVPIAGIQPDIVDAVDFDAYAQELAIKQRISRRILRTKEEIDSMREARQKEQAMQAMAGAAQPVSQAVLNLSKAREAGGIAA